MTSSTHGVPDVTSAQRHRDQSGWNASTYLRAIFSFKLAALRAWPNCFATASHHNPASFTSFFLLRAHCNKLARGNLGCAACADRGCFGGGGGGDGSCSDCREIMSECGISGGGGGSGSGQQQVPAAPSNLADVCSEASQECCAACEPGLACTTSAALIPECNAYSPCQVLLNPDGSWYDCSGSAGSGLGTGDGSGANGGNQGPSSGGAVLAHLRPHSPCRAGANASGGGSGSGGGGLAGSGSGSGSDGGSDERVCAQAELGTALALLTPSCQITLGTAIATDAE